MIVKTVKLYLKVWYNFDNAYILHYIKKCKTNPIFSLFSAKLGGGCTTPDDCTAVIPNTQCSSGKCACATDYVAASNGASCLAGKHSGY